MPFLLRPESHRAEITDFLSKLFKRPVIVGPISIGYWPPSLRLEQVGVMKEGTEPLIQVDHATALLDWKSLFQLKLVPTELELVHWTFTAARQADGHWDVEDWLSGTTGFSSSKSWAIQKIHWKEGEIHAVDHFATVPQEMILIGVEGNWDVKQGAITTAGGFSGVGSPARFTLSARGQFISSPQWTGDLQLADQADALSLHIERAAQGFDIKGGSPKWRLAQALTLAKFYLRTNAATTETTPIALEQWQLHLKKDGKKLTFEHSGSISGGLSELKGESQPSPSGLTVRMDGALKEVPAEALVQLTGDPIQLDGKVTGIAKGMEIIASSRTLATFKGTGYWELKEGHYRVPAASVNKLSKAKLMAYIKQKFPLFETTGVPIQKLGGHWQAKDGILNVADGRMDLADIRAAWVGKIDLPHQGIDGYVRLQIREKDPKLARLVIPKYRTGPANGRLQGTWQEWSLRAFPSSKIPAGAQAALRKALK